MLLIYNHTAESKNNRTDTENLNFCRYLICDFMMAIVLECFQEDRLQHLKFADNYYLNYLDKCIKYDLVPKEGSEYSELVRYFIEDKDDDDVKEERFAIWLKNVPRDVKIDRMKRIMRLKSTECSEKLFASKDPNCEELENNEDVDEGFWINWINCCVLMTLDRLGLLLREVELIEAGQNIEVIQPVSKVSNDKLTKVEKPFKLVKDRKQIAADAFKYGHNLPTMTIDEYLELEKKRGNIKTGGGAASAIKKEIDEDDEAAMEIELLKARQFDEFKDSKLIFLLSNLLYF